MKKLILTLFALLVLTSPAFAEETPAWKTLRGIRALPDFKAGYIVGHVLNETDFRCDPPITAGMVTAVLDAEPRQYEDLEMQKAIWAAMIRLGCRVPKATPQRME